jgi:hypothetical protein
MLGNYAPCPVSPWWLTLCPNKWSPLGMGLLLGGPLDKCHRAIPNHAYHFSHFIIFTSLSFGIFECIDPRRDCTSFYGKKGLKAQTECSRQKIKAKTITFQMLVQGGLENNKTFLLKNQRPTRNKFILYRCPTCRGIYTSVLQPLLYPYGTMCTSPFK